jgi:hypothetical protein
MIKPIEEMNRSNLEIDLTGPKGNAFYLMSLANHLANEMCLDGDEIIKEMKSGDYENLLRVFDGYFGGQVILYR